MTTSIPAKYATTTLAQARASRQMTLDVLEENPNAEWAQAHLAVMELIIKVRSGETSSDPQFSDDVTVGRKAGSAAGNQYGTFAVHAASERQVAFLAKLINSKDSTGIKLPTTLEGISKKSASALIDKLINRQDKAGVVNKPSEKQIAFIKRLLGEKDLSGTAFTNPWTIEVEGQTVNILDTLDGKQAKATIDMLLKLPRKAVKVAAELEIGIYRNAQGVYKVYPNQSKTRMLAKLLVLPEGWMEMTYAQREASAKQPWWDYAGMAYRFVKADQKMSKEEAQAFGKITSVCCNCGRMLTDEGSIEAGIGPVCAKKWM